MGAARRRDGAGRGQEGSMRLKPQYLFILTVLGLVVLWMVVRSLFAGGEHKAEAKTAQNAPPSVQAMLTPETQREVEVVVRGRTAATRTVQVRSETAGVVAATPVLQR